MITVSIVRLMHPEQDQLLRSLRFLQLKACLCRAPFGTEGNKGESHSLFLLWSVNPSLTDRVSTGPPDANSLRSRPHRETTPIPLPLSPRAFKTSVREFLGVFRGFSPLFRVVVSRYAA